MKPIQFPQVVKVLQKPSTMSDKECLSLPVWSDGKQCVSCWKPSIKERINILFGGNVWLGVLSGKSQPPVFVSGEMVFQKTPFLARLKAFIIETKESIIEAYNNVKNGFKQPDKRKQFVVGFVISLVIGVFAPFLGVANGCAVGAIKEWWDSKGHGTPEKMDFIFTCLGALSALPLTLIIHNLIW